MNIVDKAVMAVGGPTKASHVCDCSSFSIYKWRKRGSVPDSRAAVLLARAAQDAGLDVTVDQLAGVEAVSGNGDGPNGGQRFRKGGHVITATYPVSSPIVPRFPDAAARAA